MSELPRGTWASSQNTKEQYGMFHSLGVIVFKAKQYVVAEVG
jgi:hypothetical protein